MSDQPNVLLVVTDQERYDLTAPTGPEVETPGTDRLAAEGLQCSRAYTPTAICSPARVSILTGLFPHAHGVFSNPSREAIRTAIPERTPTIGHVARDAGYQTDYVGKWHIAGTTPREAGFTAVTGWAHSRDQTIGTAGYRAFATARGVDPNAVSVADGVTSMPAEATQTAYLAERAVDQLERYAAIDEPFLLRLDFPGPHNPYVVPQTELDRYDPSELDPWPSFRETFAGKPAIHSIHPSYYGVADRTWSEWAGEAVRYFAFETLIEAQFARVLDALDQLDLAEETLVIRTSDHGEFVGHHRQGNKGPLMYEDSYRVPFAVRWPGVVDAGSTSDALVSLVDILPTICSAIDSPIPPVHGRDLVSLFQDPAIAWRDAVFAEYHGEPETLYTQRMIRTDRYKFVYNGPDINELYDLSVDPHELANLIDHPAYADVRNRLARRLGDWMVRTDDHVAIDRYRRRCEAGS